MLGSMTKCMSETPVFQTLVNSNIQSNLQALSAITYHLKTQINTDKYLINTEKQGDYCELKLLINPVVAIVVILDTVILMTT